MKTRRKQTTHKNSTQAQVAIYSKSAPSFNWPEIVEKMADSTDQQTAEKYAAALHRARPAEDWLPHELAQICDTARCMAQRDKACKQLDAEGMTILTVTGQTKLHPAATALQGFRASISQSLRVLGMSGRQGAKSSRPETETMAGHARKLNAAQPLDFCDYEKAAPRNTKGQIDYSLLKM